MEDPSKTLTEVRLSIQDIKETTAGRFFEIGADPGPLRQIESLLAHILTLLDSSHSYYAQQSMEKCNHYYDALRLARKTQETIKTIRLKGEGSRDNTSRVLSSITDLEESLNRLACATENESVEPFNADISVKNNETEDDYRESVASQNHSFPPKPSVFLSYAWEEKSEKIADQLEPFLKCHNIKIVRDKNDIEYKGSIKEFMERIGRSNCIIVIISDKYLRSSNCMFELVEIAAGKQFYDRVFPIVLEDANIYDPVKRIGYVKYWEGKKRQLGNAMKTVGQENLQGIREDMDLYDRIRDNISSLTSILKDMNTLTPEMHQNSNFDKLYTSLERRLSNSS